MSTPASSGAGPEDQTPAPASESTARHWDRRFRDLGPTEVSWYQPEPTMSLQLIGELFLRPEAAIIDIGGGASRLVDELAARGHRDLTVLDISGIALATARARLGNRAEDVTWVRADLRDWAPARCYRLWHDRAVFHFLTDPTDQARYRALATAAIAPGGHLVIGTFAAEGPTHCSGLPVARYAPEQLADAFAPGFLPVTSRRETHHTPGGTPQPFTWQVLRRMSPAAEPTPAPSPVR